MDMDYTLIASFIRKQQHRDRYGDAAANPYDLALEYALERLVPLLENLKQDKVYIIAEGRGKKEDDDLRKTFHRFVTKGNEYMTAARVKKIDFDLAFRQKEMNLVGMQIADLAAYPIARHIIDATKSNPNFDILRSKFYNGLGQVHGLKIFP